MTGADLSLQKGWAPGGCGLQEFMIIVGSSQGQIPQS